MPDDLTSRAGAAEQPPPQQPPQQVVVEKSGGNGGIGCFGFLLILGAIYWAGEELGLIDDDEKKDGNRPRQEQPDTVQGIAKAELPKANVSCAAKTCEVTYHTEAADLLISAQEFMIEEQRPVWKAIAKDDLASATITAEAELVSVGGKESVGPALEITCTAEDQKQIDWDNVLVDGLRRICDYRELVNFE